MSRKPRKRKAGAPTAVEEPAATEIPDELKSADLEAAGGEPPAPGEAGTETVAVIPASTTSLARRDPLHAYMNEVGRYPLLGPEEERELALRVRDDGDVDAAVRLATSNLRLVVSIAMQYRSSWTNLLDLIQEGNVGLMKAVDKFDPHRGLRFSTYATWWVKAYILKYLLDNWSLVRIGTSNARRKVFFNLRKEREKLRLQGIEPDPELLAATLQVSEKDVQEVGQALDATDVSIDAPVGSESTLTPGEFLPALAPLPEEVAAERESHRILRQQFARFAGSLPARERAVFEDRLAAEEPQTLKALAQRFGMTKEGIRQVEKRVVASFRDFVRRELRDYDLHLAGVNTGDH